MARSIDVKKNISLLYSFYARVCRGGNISLILLALELQLQLSQLQGRPGQHVSSASYTRMFCPLQENSASYRNNSESSTSSAASYRTVLPVIGTVHRLKRKLGRFR